MRKRKRLGNPYLGQIGEDVVPEKIPLIKEVL
jgi:hypothetical protein